MIAHRYAVLALLCAQLGGCAAPDRNSAPTRPQLVPDHARLAQIGYGTRARFSICRGQECPQVTRKTLAFVVAEHAPSDPAGATKATPEHGLPSAQPEEPITVLFAPNSAVLDQKARMLIDAHVKALGQKTAILVRGRTDSTGSVRVNARLARLRTLAVTRYLEAKLPGSDVRFRRDARGKCCYVAPNNTAAGRAANRRAELAGDSTGRLSSQERE